MLASLQGSWGCKCSLPLRGQGQFLWLWWGGRDCPKGGSCTGIPIPQSRTTGATCLGRIETWKYTYFRSIVTNQFRYLTHFNVFQGEHLERETVKGPIHYPKIQDQSEPPSLLGYNEVGAVKPLLHLSWRTGTRPYPSTSECEASMMCTEGAMSSVERHSMYLRQGSCDIVEQDSPCRKTSSPSLCMMIGAPLPSILDIFLARCSSKATSIVKDPTHLSHSLFQLLSSGRRYRSIRARSARLLNSFFPQAVRALNSNYLNPLWNLIHNPSSWHQDPHPTTPHHTTPHHTPHHMHHMKTVENLKNIVQFWVCYTQVSGLDKPPVRTHSFSFSLHAPDTFL